MYVNGPINVVRLKGSVDKTSKVLYLFMDHHEPPHSQKKCEDQRATNVDTFFVE